MQHSDKLRITTVKLLPILLVLLMGTGSAQAQVSSGRFSEIAKRANTLAEDEAAFWLKYGPDPLGGIYGLIREDGSNSSEQKGLIQQSRFLWTFSTLYERGFKTQEIKSLCDNIYTFITQNMSLESGSFVSAVSANGKTVTDPKKMCYSESFAIFGLSQYGRVFGNTAAVDRAMSCFRAMVKRSWDPVHLGFDLTKDDAPMGGSGTVKETNTHIHVMEAFTALYIASGNEEVKDKVKDMVSLLCTKIIQPSGYCQERFNKDWSIMDNPAISYGHDIETAWLMLESAEALGLMKDSLILKKSMQIGIKSSQQGFETETGCFLNKGIPDGNVTDFTRNWWPQNEGLLGHWWMYKLTEDTSYIKKIESGLSWIENKQRSKKSKVLYWTVDKNGTPTGANVNIMGSFWKTSYHTIRSYLFLRDWAQTQTSVSASGYAGRVSPIRGNDGWNISFTSNMRHIRLQTPVTIHTAIALRLFTPSGQCIVNVPDVKPAGGYKSMLIPVKVSGTAKQLLIAEIKNGNDRHVVNLPFNR